jgi:competence protein ComEC
MRRSIILAGLVSVALLLALSFTAGLAAPTGPLHVSFIDVGQGDSALIHDADGFDVLIDGGPPAAGPTVVAYLRQQGLGDVDVMLATHADADHIGGLIDVLAANDIPVRQVLYSGYAGTTQTWSTFATAVANEGLALQPATYPADYQWGQVGAHVLNPLPGLAGPPQNDACVVTRLDFGNEHLLFVCDISGTVEPTVLAHLTPVAAQILKVAHHGSAYGSGTAFLAAVRPADAVISVGPNSYGHPAPETLARLQAAGARIWRTDRSGTITLVTDGFTHGITPAVPAPPPGLDLRVYLPVISNPAPPTPTATPTVPPPTATPTPPTDTPTPPTPVAMPGENVVCQESGPAQICASVSSSAPARYTSVTVYGRLRVSGTRQGGQTMSTTWRYKTTTADCSGTTGNDGLATCSRGIGAATVGYPVNVDVAIGGYQATTSFTPQ